MGLVKKMEMISTIANDAYRRLMVKWIDHDVQAMCLSIVMAIFMFFTHQFVSFSGSDFEQDWRGLIGLTVNVLLFIAAYNFGLFSTKISAIACILIVKGQCWRQRKAYFDRVYGIA